MMSRRCGRGRAPGALAVAVLGAVLAGCGGGGGGGSTAAGGGGGGGTPPVATVALQVTPSLGQVFSGTVRVIAPGGGGQEVAELARSKTRSSGSADLDVPADAEGPFIIEVAGNDEASYYDEGSEQTLPLGEDDVIRAVVEELPAEGVGVTPLTELAVRHLEAQFGPLTSLSRAQLQALFSDGSVAAAYAAVRRELAPELGDTPLTALPTVVGSAADLAALGTRPADLYALKLAALARLGHLNGAPARPALAMLQALGEDLADGVFDGRQGAITLPAAPYDLTTFADQLRGSAEQLAAASELKTLVAALETYVSSFVTALGKVSVPADDGGGTSGGGDSGSTGGSGGSTGGSGSSGSGSGGGGEVVTLPTPGDLLRSWAGHYHGNWNVERLEVYTKVPTLTSPFYKWVRDPLSEDALRLSMTAMTFGSNSCNWVINTGAVQFGSFTLPFNEAYAVAATGEARSYSLPVTLTVLGLGVTGTTTMATQGLLPTRIALAYEYRGLLKEIRYRGACTFTYRD